MASAKGNGVAFVRNILKYVGEGGGFDKLLEKVKVVSAGGGRCLVEMVVEDGHLNKGGTLHGGFTATLIDSISTFALMTHGKGAPGVSVNMNINYLKPAAKGEEILIDAQTRRAGRTLAFLDVDITKKVSGELVATGWKEVFEWPQDRRPFMHEHPEDNERKDLYVCTPDDLLLVQRKNITRIKDLTEQTLAGPEVTSESMHIQFHSLKAP